MSGYIGNAPVPHSTQTRQTFTAVSGQTSFATIGYVAGGQFIQVYLNGVLLKLTDDYTAANGSDIVLTSGAATGDILEFITFADFTVNNQNFTGGLTVDNDGSTVLTVDRATSDGTIIDLQKSGSSVGVIGTRAGFVRIGTGDTGLEFHSGDNTIYSANMSTNGLLDGALNLGSGSYRFKDLYLSGGVYLGGTGSANKLDDYEEGTWTPTWYGSGGSPTISYGTQLGRYVKVGNVVFVSVRIDITSKSGGAGSLSISGLPFTVSSTPNYFPAAYLGYKANFSTAGPDYLRFTGGTTRIELHADNNTSEFSLTPSNLSQTTAVIAGGFYQV
jgi:hypothetical protein